MWLLSYYSLESFSKIYFIWRIQGVWNRITPFIIELLVWFLLRIQLKGGGLLFGHLV